MIDQETIGLLMKGVNNVTWQSLVMIGVSFVLFYLAIAKDYEPLLLLPLPHVNNLRVAQARMV